MKNRSHHDFGKNIYVFVCLFFFLPVEVIYNWMHCFPVSTGTPESDTVCKRCPEGFFSNVTSSKAACQKHTNCSSLGFKIALKGNAVRDNVCQENTDTSPQKCGIGMYHIMYHIKQECSENIPLSIVIMKVSAFMLKIPTDLPATELDVASEQQHCKDRFLVLVFFKQFCLTSLLHATYSRDKQGNRHYNNWHILFFFNFRCNPVRGGFV